MITPWLSPEGAVIRVDRAAAMKSLDLLAQNKDSVLNKHKITFSIGRTYNKNKNPAVDNLCRQIHKDINKSGFDQQTLTDFQLLTVQNVVNSRIRDRRLSAKEMFTSRDNLTNDHIDIGNDKSLAKKQLDIRQRKHQIHETDKKFKVGDLVFISDYLKRDKPREFHCNTGRRSADFCEEI